MTAAAPATGHKRFRFAILGSIAVLVLTIIVGIWLAVTVRADTTVTVDATSGDILIEGPEQEFVGSVTGRYGAAAVTVSGLPALEPLKKDAVGLRAVCAIRDDPATDWSQAAPQLRGHLQTAEMDALCAPLV